MSEHPLDREERPSTVNADLLAQWKTVMLTRGDRAERAHCKLYEAAEDASYEGMSLEEAIQTVRDGYSSIEADRMTRRDP